MALAAEVPCSGSIGAGRVPLENREFGTAALNHKPANRIAGDDAADFTSEFLKGRHRFLILIQLGHRQHLAPPHTF
jgi:hypothetical protein